MDTLSAFAIGQSALAAGNRRKVFDWHKAAKIIADRKPREAVAGLSSDMEWTAGPIYSGGTITPREETYTYLASIWATPVLVLDSGEEIDCWIYDSDSPGWDSGTYWPESARAMLAGKVG